VYAISRDIWGEAASSQAVKSSPFSITISGVYDTAKRNLYATIKVNALVKAGGEYYLDFVISEDSVNNWQYKHFVDDGHNDTLRPFYHMNVVRKMVTGWGGVLLTSNGVTQGQSFTKTQNYTMNATWKRKNLKLTAFVTHTDTVSQGGVPKYMRDAIRQTEQNYLDSLVKFTPVEMISFYAQEASGHVRVTWTTEHEMNNRGWYLERSANRGQWERLSFIDGHGTTGFTQMYEYTDNNVTLGGKYEYRLRQMDFDGKETFSDVAYVMMGGLPSTTRLMQNYPNPFNPSTTLTIELASPSYVHLNVYDEMGRQVATLANGDYSAGVHFIQWNGTDDGKNVLPAGTYYARLSTDNGTQHIRMTISK
jgi:hypothetical protein